MTAQVPQPPAGQRGYLVNPGSGTVHLRYAPHAGDAIRVSTPQGVLNLLDGIDPKACRKCFPHGNRQIPQVEARKGQRRRVETSPE